MMEPSVIQNDTISELINVSIGRAASSLNKLVDEEIILTVPNVRFVKRVDVARLVDECSVEGVCAIVQKFSGPFCGDALLIFPEEKSFELVRAIIGEDTPVESLINLGTDALTEVGNIVLNASLGSLANLLSVELLCTLPECIRGNGEVIFGLDKGNRNNGDMAMFMEVNFELKQRKISGYVVFVLDVDSADNFLKLIDGYVDKVIM